MPKLKSFEVVAPGKYEVCFTKSFNGKYAIRIGYKKGDTYSLIKEGKISSDSLSCKRGDIPWGSSFSYNDSLTYQLHTTGTTNDISDIEWRLYDNSGKEIASGVLELE